MPVLHFNRRTVATLTGSAEAVNAVMYMHVHPSACLSRLMSHTHNTPPDTSPGCALVALQLAAAWCLLVQDLLMWQDWPGQLLSLPQFKEEWSGGVRGSGQLLFRGPRIR